MKDAMTESTVLDVHGLNWASSTAVVEATLLRRPGVTSVEANAVNQTATVVYDPRKTPLLNWLGGCVIVASTARDDLCRITCAIRWLNLVTADGRQPRAASQRRRPRRLPGSIARMMRRRCGLREK